MRLFDPSVHLGILLSSEIPHKRRQKLHLKLKLSGKKYQGKKQQYFTVTEELMVIAQTYESFINNEYSNIYIKSGY